MCPPSSAPMAVSTVEEQLNRNPKLSEEEDSSNEDEEEEEEALSGETRSKSDRDELADLVQRLSIEGLSLRVHDVIVTGNIKTKESLFENEIQALKKATTMQELLHASALLTAYLRGLEIFDAVNITLDSGPPELPHTTNVFIKLVENKSPLRAEFGIFNMPEARSWTAEGTLKFKNTFGYGDIWDATWAYGWGEASEISAGVSLPRLKGLKFPLMARISLLSQDWLKISSYEERSLGFSLGLISTRHHDLDYNLTSRNLTDPSQMSSRSVRMQLGHSLISSLRYKFSIDKRDSPLRPTRGYAFVSNTQIGGLTPDSRSLRFVRQEFDLRYAFPLGFYNAALNFGLSVGAIFPWGCGFMNMSSPFSERFFLGGQSSPVCTLGGPRTLLGFRTRGLGPTELRRLKVDRSDIESSVNSPGRDVLGGDLAVTAFADLSFNLPLKVFRDAGVHGHVFACAGNVAKLTENEFRNFSVRKFGESFRTSAGAGIIVPTKILRMEINYCYILNQLEHDRGKTGIQFSFSSPL